MLPTLITDILVQLDQSQQVDFHHQTEVETDLLHPIVIHRIEVAEVLYLKEVIDTHLHQTEMIDILHKTEIIDTLLKIEVIDTLHQIAVIETTEAEIDSLRIEAVVDATNKEVINQEKEVALTKAGVQKE